MNPITIEYIKLIYKSNKNISKHIKNLWNLIFKKKIPLETANLILNGD